MLPPHPPLARWGRGLQFLGGLVLQVAPFLPWASVPVLSLTVPVPGILLHAGVTLVVGFVALLLAVLRRPLPGVQVLLAALAGGFLVYDLRLVLERTEYVLGRAQLSLAGLNSTLARLGAEPIDLMPRGADPWSYVGFGIWVAVAGLVVLVLGAVIEAFGQASSGKRLESVLISLPRCSSCGHRVGFDMGFCPGCGRSQTSGSACAGCGAWLAEAFRFCPSCGKGR